jgi:hypothetical protein
MDFSSRLSQLVISGKNQFKVGESSLKFQKKENKIEKFGKYHSTSQSNYLRNDKSSKAGIYRTFIRASRRPRTNPLLVGAGGLDRCFP